MVVIVHTSMGTGPLSKQLTGHLDVYPNGGRSQPTCRGSKNENCSHLVVVDYYVEAILKPDSLVSVRCRNWAFFRARRCTKDIASMGTLPPDDDNHLNGYYYMVTNRRAPPHGLGKDGLRPQRWDDDDNAAKPGLFKKLWKFFKNIFG